MAVSGEDKLSAVTDVDIDDSGKFKYVLIKLYLGEKSKCVVRGYSWAEYHADIYEDFQQRVMALGIETECLGGGRIEHSEKKLFVYGYSMGFGRADHTIAVKLLKESYPDYTSITYSNDGY
eukprot:TCONS_00058914-protein